MPDTQLVFYNAMIIVVVIIKYKEMQGLNHLFMNLQKRPSF